MGYTNLDHTFAPACQDESQLPTFRVANCDTIGENSRTGHIIILFLLTLQVRGHIDESTITINKPVYPNLAEGFTHMMCCQTEGEEIPPGVKMRNAVTELMVLQRGLYGGEPATKLRLCPKTGKSRIIEVKG